jgi:hypothetical protein
LAAALANFALIRVKQPLFTGLERFSKLLHEFLTFLEADEWFRSGETKEKGRLVPSEERIP